MTMSRGSFQHLYPPVVGDSSGDGPKHEDDQPHLVSLQCLFSNGVGGVVQHLEPRLERLFFWTAAAVVPVSSYRSCVAEG